MKIRFIILTALFLISEFGFALPLLESQEISAPFQHSKYGMSWHHCIPYSTLRDFWNSLGELNPGVPSKTRRVTQNYMDLIGLNPYQKKLVIDSDELSGKEYDNWLEKMVWQSYNLDEGPNPNEREDDPGNKLDLFKNKTRMDHKIWDLQIKVTNLYGAMHQLIDAVEINDDVEIEKALDSCLSAIKAMQQVKKSSRNKVRYYDESLWSFHLKTKRYKRR